mgnify:FL=1
MGTFEKYTVGLHNVGSYQSSGKPFITGSAHSAADRVHMIEFPSVSKSFTVINTNAVSQDIRVHFQSGSDTAVTAPGLSGQQTTDDANDVFAGNHFISVAADASLTMDVKCKQFYISTKTADTSYQVFAELTNIPTSRMYHLTGSGITSTDGS